MFLTLFGPISKAELPKIVQCLALEEENFHKNKYTGPEYKLNQAVINYLSIENDLKFTTNFEATICDSGFKSFDFIKIALIEKNKILHELPKNLNETEILTYAMKINTFLETVYDIFLTYLGLVQMEIQVPNCLNRVIPNYDSYLEKEKYLKDIQSQINNEESIGVLSSLFEEIRHPNVLRKKCSDLPKQK